MQRTPPTSQLLGSAQWSKHLRWQVTLMVDNRANVTEAEALAIYGQGPEKTHGHHHVQVGPFDSLADVLGVLLVESALACSEQLRLF